MKTEAELIRDTLTKVQKGRQPTVFSVLMTIVITRFIEAWLFMLGLGIVAISVGVPGIALSFWVSLGLWSIFKALRK